MAIIGGAGNPVGGSFTGPAQALEVVGDHAYGYSGVIATNSNAETTYMEFTSGNFYLVGFVNFNSIEGGHGSVMTYKIYFNGSVIQGYDQANATGSDQAEPDASLPIIIPSYTEVKCTCTSADAADLDQVVSITGRIYRTRV